MAKSGEERGGEREGVSVYVRNQVSSSGGVPAPRRAVRLGEQGVRTDGEQREPRCFGALVLRLPTGSAGRRD